MTKPHYPPPPPQSKSLYTLDTRSEYGAPLPVIWADESITGTCHVTMLFIDHTNCSIYRLRKVAQLCNAIFFIDLRNFLYIAVYLDESPGAKVKVCLQPELEDPVAMSNDSGFYGDGLSRHGSNNSGLHRDSCSSDNSDANLVLGTLSVAPETSWVTMDTKIGNIFMVSRTTCPET